MEKTNKTIILKDGLEYKTDEFSFDNGCVYFKQNKILFIIPLNNVNMITIKMKNEPKN